MIDQPIIPDKDDFKKKATEFLETMFKEALSDNLGEIEIRALLEGWAPRQNFCKTIDEAVEYAYDFCNSGYNIYFGVNPRIAGQGEKENVHYLMAFHLDIDYGIDGHKKESKYKTYEEALNAINSFEIKPSIILHSGGGFHCFFLLKNPAKVEEIGLEVLENINKALLSKVGGDKGTQNIDRILRVPGTFNFKSENNPKKVEIIHKTKKKSDLKDFIKLIENEACDESEESEELEELEESEDHIYSEDKFFEHFPIPYGNDESHSSKSEVDINIKICFKLRQNE